ncbi:hypothetical protein M0805_005161 [Coniferiporia weirii]|nr:hypothetical protein M0805_005161 [Coniferiporia weirii]
MSSPDPLQGAPSSPVMQERLGEDMAMEVGSPHTPQAQTGKRSADTITPLVHPAQVMESQWILFESVARFEDLHCQVNTGPPDSTPAQTAYELAQFIGRMLAHCHVTLLSLKQAQEGGTHPQNMELHNVVTQYRIVATGYDVDLPAPFATGAHGPPPQATRPPPPSDKMRELKAAMLKLTSNVGTISRQVSTLAAHPPPRPQQASRTPAPTNVGGTQTTLVAPAPTAGAPISYAQAVAQPMALTNPPQTTTAASAKKKKKSKQQLPPPPKMYAKDPTLVLSTGLHVPRADSHLSGSILTQQAWEFFDALPTADRIMVLSSAFNVKGNIMSVFTHHPPNATPTTETIIDRHQVVFARHMHDRCLVTDAVLPDDFILSPSRIRQRSALRISMVPTTDMFGSGGKIFTPTQLLLEVKHNPALRNLDFVIPPHFATPAENVSNLKQCPVSFSFTDPDGQVRTRLLKKPHIWLFGTSLQLLVPPVRPGLTQCEHCQALSHGTKGCKAPAMCTKCASNHCTINHRKSCADCATEANESDLCPHPHHCHHCGGDHPTTFSACPKKRRFRSILAGQEQDFPILPKEEEY